MLINLFGRILNIIYIAQESGIKCEDLPALMTSTPVGYQRSPCRSRSRTVLGGKVLQ